MRPPNFWKRLGSRRKSTSSFTSSLASSTPATSANVVVIWSSPSRRALLLPKLIGPPRPPPPPCIWRIKNMNTAIMIRIGKLATSNWLQTLCCSGLRPSTTTLCCSRSSISLGSSTIGRIVSKLLPSLRSPEMVSPSTTTRLTRSDWISWINSEYPTCSVWLFMLKLLNTDNNTAAITSQSSKFLTISFNTVTSPRIPDRFPDRLRPQGA